MPSAGRHCIGHLTAPIGRVFRIKEDALVEQHTKVEFVINLKTTKEFGLTFSLPLLGRADEVIE